MTYLKKSGYLVMVGNRFYYRHNEKRVLTAWSSDGAKKFCCFLSAQALALELIARHKKNIIVTPDIYSNDGDD